MASLAIGWVDDYLKLTRRSSRGMPSRYKFLAQLVVGTCAAYWIMTLTDADIASGLAMPFYKGILLQLGWFFIPFGVFGDFAGVNYVAFVCGGNSTCN